MLALQDHPGRRLLEGAELTGRTRERWEAAEPGLSLLWSLFDTYSEALAAARAVRSRRSRPSQSELIELTELLQGAGVTVSGSRLPDAGHSLTGGARLSEQVSLIELVQRMNGWYARIIEVASAADAVWSALPARIDLLGAELGRVRALARRSPSTPPARRSSSRGAAPSPPRRPLRPPGASCAVPRALPHSPRRCGSTRRLRPRRRPARGRRNSRQRHWR